MKRYVNLLNGPILPALSALALPIMATSLIQMAYNLTDMLWIGRLGADAVASVGAAGMFMWLSNGLATLAKMGGQIRVGQSLGEQKDKDASMYAQCALQMGIVFALLFSLLAIVFSHPMIDFFQLNSASVAEDARIYLIITCGLVIFSFMNQVLTGIMTAMGNSKSSFHATAVGLGVNLVLDPLLIFGWFGFPAWGVAGAAIATVIAQAIVTLMFLYALRRDTVLFPHVHLLRLPDMTKVKEIFLIGLPTALQSMLFSCISMIIARIIAAWGDGAVAIQKVGSQIESISWMSAEGYAAALNSFVAQNYGAGNVSRIRKGFSISVYVMVGWGILTGLILFLFPHAIMGIFIQEANVAAQGTDYLRILALSQAFMCLEYAAAGAFNGLGRTLPPSLVGVSLTAARIPLALGLSQMIGLNGVWWAITLSSVGKGVVLFIWFFMAKKKVGFLQKEEKAEAGNIL